MLDVRNSPELQAVVLLLKSAAAPVRKEMRAGARRALNELWKPELQSRATTRLQSRVLVGGARSKVQSDTFTMLAATSKRSLSGGLTPAEQWHGAEFGATPRTVEVRVRGRNRRQRINAGFGARNKRGKVVYPAAREIGPKIVAAWVRGVVRGLAQGNKDLETR